MNARSMKSIKAITSLRNLTHLSDSKNEQLAEMIELYPALGKAYRLKTLFNNPWPIPNKVAAEAFITQYCAEVEAPATPAFMRFVNTLKSTLKRHRSPHRIKADEWGT